MILSDSEVTERLESPDNLINRLRSGMFSGASRQNKIIPIPSLPPIEDISSSELIDDLEDKLKAGQVRSKATALLVDAIDELKLRLTEVTKPKELSSIASDMSKILVNHKTITQKESTEGPQVQVIVYTPRINNESHYNVIDLSNEKE